MEFFSHCHRVQTGCGAYTASFPMCTRGSNPGLMGLGREADRSRSCGAEVKNAWCYTSTAPIRLHGVVLS